MSQEANSRSQLSQIPTDWATDQEQAELKRLRATYARRRQASDSQRYARINPFTLCSLHEREYAMASLFRAAGLSSLSGLRILDVGCNRGDTLRLLLDYGADPALLFGIDLMEDRALEAAHLSPHLQIACANAMSLPFPDATFDMVLQFVLFTSILSEDVKRTVADEMRRVLAPRGKVLWYDFMFNNPKNAEVRGIRKAEIKELFPGFSCTFRRITLAPPLGRIVAPVTPLLYFGLARVRGLCTHCLCLLQKHEPDHNTSVHRAIG